MTNLYQELYEAWRREKRQSELQNLPKDFYDRTAEYVKKLKESQRMLDDKTLKARLSRRELENIRRLSRELIEARLDKVLRLSAGGGAPTTSTILATHEEPIFETLVDASTQFLRIERDTYEGRGPEVPKKERVKTPETILVRFLCEIPAIVGVDMKTYGPFKSEDVASLPAENARSLIYQEAAVEIEVE